MSIENKRHFLRIKINNISNLDLVMRSLPSKSFRIKEDLRLVNWIPVWIRLVKHRENAVGKG